jgi:arylsulfatase
MAVRYENWKLSFKTIKGNLFTGHVEETNLPLVTNLRQDPWERYQVESQMYLKWWGDKLWTAVPAGVITAEFVQTFRDYPPSQVGGSWNVDGMLKKTTEHLNTHRN